mmetsp:Transcript_58941/g.117104  ORF Transcript_58941/g.117104 Transcript_58941/m.117104 type:complete len:357 (-) Transcript_58941:105-1175(-)
MGVLAEALQLVCAHGIRVDALCGGDLARMGLHGGEVDGRLLRVQLLQRDVGGRVGRHVRDRTNEGQQPAGLLLDEALRGRGHHPKSKLALASTDAARGRATLLLVRHLRLLLLRYHGRDLGARDAKDGADGRRWRRRVERRVDGRQSLLDVDVGLYIGTAVGLDDCLHFLLLLVRAWQRPAVGLLPCIDSLDEQHDPRRVRKVVRRKGGQIGILGGDKRTECRRRVQDAQIGKGMVGMRFDDLMLAEVEAQVAKEAVRVQHDERQLAGGADGRDALQISLDHLRRNDKCERVQKLGATCEDFGYFVGDVRTGDVLVEFHEHLSHALRTGLAKAVLVEEEIVAQVSCRHSSPVNDRE